MIGAVPGEPGMDLLGALASGRLDPAAGASTARSPHAAVDGPERPVCSRRGCTAEAAWACLLYTSDAADDQSTV